MPESKDSASSSRDQLPSDPAVAHAEDPAAAETLASSPDAAVEKPVGTPPPASGWISWLLYVFFFGLSLARVFLAERRGPG